MRMTALALLASCCLYAAPVYSSQAPAPVAASAAGQSAQKRTHNDMMRDIATTRGRFTNAVNAGNAAAVVEEGTKLESVYREMVTYYEQNKLAQALQFAKIGLTAATEGVAAGKARNFEAAAATHRALSRSCMNCHPIYRQETPDGMSYLPQWKPQYRSLP